MFQQQLRQLSLSELVQECRAESSDDRNREKGYCFELFRRAIDEQNQAAWTAIEQQYGRLILNWIFTQWPMSLSQQDARSMAQETLTTFWRTLTTRAVPLASHFEHVGALIKYMQQCAITTVIDHQRRAQRQQRLMLRLQSIEEPLRTRGSMEDAALDRVTQQQQIERARRWLMTNIIDAQEKRVLYLSFELDLDPTEIARRYPAEFPDAQLVRRIKERILKRARRALSDPDRPD